MKHHTFLLVLAAILVSGSLRAQVPRLVNYQGRVAVNGANFDGTGQFKFALVNANGSVTFWSNNGTSVGGSEPSAAVTLTVTQGLYSLLLGDTALGANMTNIPSAVFSNPNVRLRVWFNDGVHGSQRLTPDQRLAPAAYLADGTVTSASIRDAAITAGKIGPDAVNGANIAPASLDSTSFAVQNPPSNGKVLGYNNGSLTWTAPGAADGLWTPSGADIYRDTGSVGIGTTSPQAGYKLDVVGNTRLAPGGSGGAIYFGTPNSETGMTILGANSRADIRFDGSTLKLLAATGIGPPPSANGIAINTTGNVAIGTTIVTDFITMEIKERPGEFYPLRVLDSSGDLLFYLFAYPGDANQLHMFGDAYKTSGGTSWIFSSDRRLKQNVRAYEPGLNEVLQLRPVRFRYRDGLKPGLTSAQEEVGFIAQEVREVIPDAVTEGKDGYLMLHADPIHWAAINAVRELNAKLEEQRVENAGLKQRLEKLEQRMNEKNGGAE